MFGDRTDLGREGHRPFFGGPALPVDGDHDGDEEDETAEADLGRVVPPEDVDGHADGDAAGHRLGERGHAADHRRTQGEVEGESTEVGDTGVRAAAAQEDHRERGEEPADGPDDRRDRSRADAGEAGQARVVGRRRHRLAEGGAVQPPRQQHGDGGHHDQDLEVGAGDDQPEDVVPLGSDGGREGDLRLI